MAEGLGQQVNLGPQPDFNNSVQHVNAAMGEVSRIPNLPLAGQGGLIIQLLQRMQGSMDQMQHDIRGIRAEQDLLPMKLFNSGAREHEDLRYPAGLMVIYPPLPVNRSELGNMTVAECNAAAAHLGLAALPGNALVGERRKQIAEYLGAPWR